MWKLLLQEDDSKAESHSFWEYYSFFTFLKHILEIGTNFLKSLDTNLKILNYIHITQELSVKSKYHLKISQHVLKPNVFVSYTQQVK